MGKTQPNELETLIVTKTEEGHFVQDDPPFVVKVAQEIFRAQFLFDSCDITLTFTTLSQQKVVYRLTEFNQKYGYYVIIRVH